MNISIEKRLLEKWLRELVAVSQGEAISDMSTYHEMSSALKQPASDMANEVLNSMIDLDRSASDTYWIGPGETVFERLASLYLKAGGDEAVLKKRWPEYFGA